MGSVLVQKIKDLERTNPAVKQQWAAYCDAHIGGTYDPSRHDLSSLLQTFLQEYGAASGPPNPKRSRPLNSGGSDTIVLAQKVKDLQKTNPAAKQQWVTFCDAHAQGTYDPMRHDAATLQTFLQDFV